MTTTRAQLDEILEQLSAELDKLGHGTAPVPNAPVLMLNVWAHDEGRAPAATVVIGPAAEDGITWGHAYEHGVTIDTPPARVAELVNATMLQGAS